MHRPNWEKIVIFNTSLQIVSGSFKTLHFFVKIPPSDLRQKVKFLASSHRCSIKSERWSSLCKFETHYEDMKQKGPNDFNVVIDVSVPRPHPYRLSRNVVVSDLDNLWNEMPYVKDYLKARDFVEVNSDQIQTQSEELVTGSMDFWEAIESIVEWISSHVVYDYNLQGQAYKGALATIRSRRAICSDFVHLLLAMTRTVNIPSRAIIGFHNQENAESWTIHSWAEVYDPKFGWTPIDATVQPTNIAKLGDRYIRLTAGYNCAERSYAYYTTPAEETDVDISVKQYVRIGEDMLEVSMFPE
ncbi:MAG: transglutaminase domain-containing protein [Candidatus Thorarchaeota archaeon]|nr:transglutaminase domain-containing protein [Candidatus Thorarchaeota archaeon]